MGKSSCLYAGTSVPDKKTRKKNKNKRKQTKKNKE